MSLFEKGTLVPTRDGFGKGLVKLGEKYDDLALVSADLEDATRAEEFMKRFPKRSFSVGIAEQNMVGLAAGLSLSGLRVFTNSFAAFLTNRAYDQIRISVAYNELPVKLVGSHGGLTVGPDGGTAQSLEDIALMRVIPGMQVVVPVDANEAFRATEALYALDAPAYMRVFRPPSPVITDLEETFEIGKAKILKEGSDMAIIGCGIILNEALLAAEKLDSEGINARVVNMHTVKPLDTATILSAASTGAVLVVEDHQISGGLGGAVAEYLLAESPVVFGQVGVRDSFGESGEPGELLEKYGLSADSIYQKALRLFKRKTEK
ncbi:MAG: transketolase family protein [Elusimicrobia bacterium]|nr:transketolase family protein [Elusimicrobiota bacterium]